VDFSNADTLDKIYMYLQQPDDFVLDEADMKYYTTLVNAYTIMSEYMREGEALMMIRGTGLERMSHAKAWRIMNDVKRLFGNVIERHKEFERTMFYDRLLHLAQLNRDALDFAEERRCLVAAAKLRALDKVEKGLGINPRDIKPIPVEITSDPAALMFDEAQVVDDGEEE